MTKSKLSSRPPLNSKRSLEDFINEPNKIYENKPRPEEVYQKESARNLPWEEPWVREDVNKIFNLRLPEPLALKLDYLSKVRRVSKHRLCLEIITPAVEKLLRSTD